LGSKNKQEDKGHITRGRYLKFIKSLPRRWYGLVDRMQNQRMSEQIATATVEGRRKEEDYAKHGETRLKRI
jgi:hypothetical protein